MTITVCYIMHNASNGGAQKSLVEMIEAFPKDKINPIFLLPNGKFKDIVFKNRWESVQVYGIPNWDHTEYSYYKNFRWIILLRELARLPGVFWGLFQLKEKKIDIFHLNEINLFWLAPILKKTFPQKPIIIHVRARVCKKDFFRTRIVNYILKKYTDSIIAIDSNTSGTLCESLHIKIVHNCYNLDKKIVSNKNEFCVGFIGTILEMKGIFDLVEAAKICKDRNLEIKYNIVGDFIKYNTIDSLFSRKKANIKENLFKLIKKNKLENEFKFFGFQSNLASMYEQMTIVCFPSHLEAVGRPIIEAAFHGKPLVVALSQPDFDMFPEEIGIRVPPHSPMKLAEAIETFYSDKNLVNNCGKFGESWARSKFECKKNSSIILDIYNSHLK